MHESSQPHLLDNAKDEESFATLKTCKYQENLIM